MCYSIVALPWGKLGKASAHYATTLALAVSTVRGLRSLGCELTITDPDGELVSPKELESSFGDVERIGPPRED
jgi:hypothetical protein